MATRTRQQGGSKLYQALDCLHDWLKVVGTSSIYSNSVHLQACILIASPSLFRATNRLLAKTTLRTVSRLKSTVLSLSDIFRASLVLKCVL